jgi:hypothetical protein
MKSKIETTIEHLDNKGSVVKYQQIMDDFKTVDVSIDDGFQRRFNGFYRMRQRSKDYYQDYFCYLEQQKKGVLNYSDALNHFYNKFHRVEASFASKLAATIDPTLPIIDKYILASWNFRLPYTKDADRIQKIVDIHAKLQQKMMEYCESSEGKEAICLFDLKFPNNTITQIKKIDFVIWQMRE